MYEHYYGVIMAGGGGTRLWPLSRNQRPKQMLALMGERSLYQSAVDRLEGVFPSTQIYVVTVEDQADMLHQQCPQIPRENFLLEPLPRGTASVVGLAAAALQDRDPQAVMAVLTADHVIENVSGFRALLKSAYEVAEDDYLVTLGITPTYPATGYGYIQRGEHLGTYQGLDAYRVQQFTEKPALSEAINMLSSGEYAWNSGMFIWCVERIMEEFSRHMPQLAAQLEEIAAVWGTADQEPTLQKVWPEILPETVDFGIMEKADRVAVIPAEDLAWRDVGSWDALFELLASKETGNVIRGAEHIGFDTSGTLIDTTENPRTVVTIGIEDMVVVDVGDILLICKKKQAQRVREVVKELKKRGRTEFL